MLTTFCLDRYPYLSGGVEDISKDQPNKAGPPITLEGLKKAAENIAQIMPSVLQITQSVEKHTGWDRLIPE